MKGIFFKIVIKRAYKTKLNPNNKQKTIFRRYSGTARFVYNWALADRIEKFKNDEKTNYFEQKKRFNALKHQEYPWIEQTAYCITQEAFKNLDLAYKNFFDKCKKGNNGKPGFPKFKSRHKGLGSFSMRGNIHVENNRIKLPCIGWVKLAESNYLPVNNAKILKATISGQAGKWFASLQVETEQEISISPDKKTIGVDIGLNSLAVCSNGKVIENHKSIKKYEKKLSRLNRELSRRKKGSENRRKTKKKLAKAYYKLGCARNASLHNASSYIVKKLRPACICVENLNVKGMLENRHLSKTISDASFGELLRQISYKAEWNGVYVIKVDQWFPSSKTCSYCGNVKKTLKLSERKYKCEKCGKVIDRDLNAALNLKNLAHEPGATACGVGVR